MPEVNNNNKQQQQIQKKMKKKKKIQQVEHIHLVITLKSNNSLFCSMKLHTLGGYRPEEMWSGERSYDVQQETTSNN